MRYLPWLSDDLDRSFAWITSPPFSLLKQPKEYELSLGVPVRRWWPAEGPEFTLSEIRGLKLTDSIPNTYNCIFVSERLKELLEEHARAEIEFLPVRLRDARERPLPERYHLANLLGTVDCVDMERSEFVRMSMDPEQILKFSRLVLDEARIPPDCRLFRIKEKPTLVIAREDLARDILKAGCNGMKFLKMEAYGKEFRKG